MVRPKQPSGATFHVPGTRKYYHYLERGTIVQSLLRGVTIRKWTLRNALSHSVQRNRVGKGIKHRYSG